MPTGVYKRSEEHREKSCRNLEKAREISYKLPRSQNQLDNAQRIGNLPRTENQREVSRKNCRILGLNRKGNHTPNPHGTTVLAGNIIKHHNDLCHGAERPNDITRMTHSEHISLHMNLRVQNGTHPWIAKNRK